MHLIWKKVKIFFLNYKKINKTTLFILSLGSIYALILISLLPSIASNTLAGDDMVFEKSYPNLTTLFSSPIQNYIGWTARLANIFTLNLLFGATPDSITPFIALPLSIGLLSISTWYLFRCVFKFLKVTRTGSLALLISQPLVLAICLYSYTTYDDFYWIAGVVTYIIPLVFFNFIAGFCLSVLRKNQTQELKIIYPIIIFLLTLVMGLYNEGFIVQLLAILIPCILMGWIILKKPSRKIFLILGGAIIGGLLAAALIMKVAPGTLYREHLNESLYLVPDHSFFGLIKMALHTTFHELKVFLIYNKFGIALVVGSTLVLSSLIAHFKIVRKLIISTLIISVLTPPLAFFSLAFAVHYAYQPSITDYSLVTAYFFTYLGIIGFFLSLFLLGYSTIHISNKKIFIIKRTAIIGGILVMGLFTYPAFQRIYQIYTLISLQHSQFIKTDSFIKKEKAKGERDITIGESVRYFTYCVPEVSLASWCNDAYRQYYNLQSIKASHYIDVETQQKSKDGKL